MLLVHSTSKSTISTPSQALCQSGRCTTRPFRPGRVQPGPEIEAGPARLLGKSLDRKIFTIAQLNHQAVTDPSQRAVYAGVGALGHFAESMNSTLQRGQLVARSVFQNHLSKHCW